MMAMGSTLGRSKWKCARASRRLLTSHAAPRRPLYAILVDAENARRKALPFILEEVARLGGDSSVRRVYGDFSKQDLSPWKAVSLDLSFRPVNAFSYVAGKDTTDAALMLDAMDMLHLNSTIDAFAIVSSDSDFTPLAQRLREAGKVVVGFGEKKTPASFMAACERFIYTENLLPRAQAGPITNEVLSSEQNAPQSIDDDTKVCRTVAQCAETVALAAAHAPSGLPLMVTASIQPVPGHATRACLCQIGRRWLRRPFSRRPRNGAVLRCSVIKNLEQKAKTRFKSSKQRRRRRRRPRRRRRRRPPRRPGGVPCMIAARIQNASCVVTILTSVPAPRTPPRESAPPVMPLKHTPHHAAYIP